MHFLTIAAAALASAVAAVPTKRELAFNYNDHKLRGVNIGGWLVLEPFITPLLYTRLEFGYDQPVDEYHLTQKLGDQAALVLEEHWNTWYTEAEFEAIAAAGLNFVRIPIGYWAFQKLDTDPYVQGQIAYLEKALGWCRTHGLLAWVDLHGAPGLQNGFDNSGLRDLYAWQEGNNQQVTLDVMKTITSSYATEEWYDVVIGIQLINEPLGPVLNMDTLKQYYADGYQLVRDNGYQVVVIHDAFQAAHYFDGQFNTPDYWNVVVDHHHYQVFSNPELERSIDDHILVACSWGWDYKSEDKWQVCGEWSAALTDCAPLLNGVFKGSRYDGTYDASVAAIGLCEGLQDLSTWDDTKKANYRRYIEAQLDAFDYAGAGWVFWTFKTELTLEWDFQRLTAAGIFPSPLTDRTYPNQCGF